MQSPPVSRQPNIATPGSDPQSTGSIGRLTGSGRKRKTSLRGLESAAYFQAPYIRRQRTKLRQPSRVDAELESLDGSMDGSVDDSMDGSNDGSLEESIFDPSVDGSTGTISVGSNNSSQRALTHFWGRPKTVEEKILSKKVCFAAARQNGGGFLSIFPLKKYWVFLSIFGNVSWLLCFQTRG